MIQHNNTVNTHISLCALAIVFTSTKWGGRGGEGCSLIRVCSLIRSNTVSVYLFNDSGIGVGDTGISLPTPITIRDIVDRTILKKDNYYYAFVTVEEPLSPYLEVWEHTKRYLHMSMFVLCWCYVTLPSIRCTVFTK